jgi:putative transposase
LLGSEQDRPDVARRREQWLKYRGRIDPSRLVFIDETWTKTNMAPLRGWAPRGQRLRDKAPFGHWKTSTFIAALREHGVTAPWLIDGAINGERFLLYVENVLVPTLRPGDIVILDNLGSHKNKAARRAIGRLAQSCCFCRNTLLTLIRSSNSSPSSNTSCEKPPSEPARTSATPWARSCGT